MTDIKPEDDRFHQDDGSPYWNESALFFFTVPEKSLSGFIYVYHRPNMKLSAGGVGLWDPSGQQMYDCLYYQFDEHQPLPHGADMFDVSLPNGLTVRTKNLQHAYHITYGGKGCELDLTWESIMNPHELVPESAGETDETNVGVKGWGSRHYEQAGRMKGTIQLDGESIDVDSWSVRDHTWGPRTPRDSYRCGYLWGVASEDSHFHVFSVSELPWDTDPIAGTTERVVGGWYTKGGVLGELVSGERRVVKRAPSGEPLEEVVDATDHLGRKLHVEGTTQNVLKFAGFGEWLDQWALCRWDFDGETAWGESHDVMTYRHISRFLRSQGQS